MKKYRSYLLDTLFICLGCLALALGVNQFLTPGRLSSGGVSTLCTVLLHLFGFRMSLTNLAANSLILLYALPATSAIQKAQFCRLSLRPYWHMFYVPPDLLTSTFPTASHSTDKRNSGVPNNSQYAAVLY